MAAPRIPGPDDWPRWTLVDRERLEHADEERPFLETAAALVTEFGELASLLAMAQPDHPEGGEPARNDAILCGLAVRIVKLSRRLVAETYEGRAELQLLLDREIFSSTAALAYLLRGRGERYEAFVRYSLGADREVWQHLDDNREQRAGAALPQEQRMRARLARSFAIAGVPPEQLDLAAESGWPPLGEQLRAVGELDAHRMHQLGSDAMHGTWNELVTHYLRSESALSPGVPSPGGLGPKLEWSAARVQPLTAVAIQASRVTAAYSRHLGHDVADAFRDKFLDIAGRAALTDRLHEEYLARADVDLG